MCVLKVVQILGLFVKIHLGLLDLVELSLEVRAEIPW